MKTKRGKFLMHLAALLLVFLLFNSFFQNYYEELGYSDEDGRYAINTTQNENHEEIYESKPGEEEIEEEGVTETTETEDLNLAYDIVEVADFEHLRSQISAPGTRIIRIMNNITMTQQLEIPWNSYITLINGSPGGVMLNRVGADGNYHHFSVGGSLILGEESNPIAGDITFLRSGEPVSIEDGINMEYDAYLVIYGALAGGLAGPVLGTQNQAPDQDNIFTEDPHQTDIFGAGVIFALPTSALPPAIILQEQTSSESGRGLPIPVFASAGILSPPALPSDEDEGEDEDNTGGEVLDNGYDGDEGKDEEGLPFDGSADNDGTTDDDGSNTDDNDNKEASANSINPQTGDEQNFLGFIVASVGFLLSLGWLVIILALRMKE